MKIGSAVLDICDPKKLKKNKDRQRKSSALSYIRGARLKRLVEVETRNSAISDKPRELFCKVVEVLKQYCKCSDLHDKQPTLLPRCEVMCVLFDP